MTKKAKLLIIEDEPAILQGLVDVFVYHGYDVDVAADGRSGLDKALSVKYDLVLLDVMLPELDGFSVCNKIRERDKQLPIVMLTAKSSEQDIIDGLTLGADDYIAKPFSVRELVLRVQAVLKRSLGPNEQCAFILLGERRIDCVNLCDAAGETTTHFSRREIDILQYLHRHGDRPVSREELLEKVWGYRQPDVIETRTVDIHIAKLRRKIETTPKQPEYLLTVRGEGYRLIAQRDA